MTMAFIAATQNGFYIVADTRTVNEGQSTYSDNNQKVFYSDKHKIGLCIAGQAGLHHRAGQESDMYVSYVVREFFEYIDREQENVQIDQLGNMLRQYVDDNYLDYHNYFKFQTPGEVNESDVSYFYGGFSGGNVKIYSHHNGVETTYPNSNGSSLQYFYNCSGEIDPIAKYIKLTSETLSQELTNEYFFSKPEAVIHHCIPYACVTFEYRQWQF
jgi:hypothetical protein